MSWEYKQIEIQTAGGILRKIRPTSSIEEACNALGREGWELVAVSPLCESHGRTAKLLYMFKRSR